VTAHRWTAKDPYPRIVAEICLLTSDGLVRCDTHPAALSFSPAQNEQDFHRLHGTTSAFLEMRIVSTVKWLAENRQAHNLDTLPVCLVVPGWCLTHLHRKGVLR